MNPDHQSPPPGPSISINDVVYTLFRHKWKIIAFTLLGFLATGVVWLKKQPLFESRAKILVRYVAERRVSTIPGESDVVREPDLRGVGVLNSEVEILTSADCMLEAVRAVGASRILEAYGGGTNEYQAASILMKQLAPKVGGSGVVTVTLSHRDPIIAREALTRVIEAYRRKHVKVHLATEAYDGLQAEADQLRTRLAQTEEELKNEKIKANVISLADAKEDISMQQSSLRSLMFTAEAELAERRAELVLHEKRNAPGLPAVDSTTNVNAEVPLVPQEKLNSFRSLSLRLADLQKREHDLLSGPYAETSKSVTQVRDQIEETQKAIAALGIDPTQIRLNTPAPLSVSGRELPAYDFDSARARVEGLEARVAQLRKQRAEIQEQAKRIELFEDTILVLERQKASQETKLRAFESNLDKARLDRAADSSKMTNISVVEEPTPAGRDMMKLYKMMGMALFGMIGAGIALAFATEMFLDGSLKRPKDVELKSHIPLFVSIPQFGTNGRSRLKLSRKQLKNGHLQDATGLIRKGEIVPWESADPMFEYYEALRDRVVMSYEGDARKPKLVAVTSCNRGAGTTRVSTGLAAALSRDVQRRVLYIGLEKNKVAVTSFLKGRPEAEFSPEAEPCEDGNELLPPDLYTLSRVGRNPEGTSIVQTFSDMLPRLRTSEYDYIIFDLPPVAETSGSLRLASQVERTLLVVESEETQKAKVDRVRDLLSDSPTRLFAVLNKTKTYGPSFLNGDS